MPRNTGIESASIRQEDLEEPEQLQNQTNEPLAEIQRLESENRHTLQVLTSLLHALYLRTLLHETNSVRLKGHVDHLRTSYQDLKRQFELLKESIEGLQRIVLVLEAIRLTSLLIHGRRCCRWHRGTRRRSAVGPLRC